jgi:DNA (cytosine-5)-methyltransferase 1
MLQQGGTTWRTAYRRTRDGVARWEVRPDAIAGCLRTARGGSSKQAVVEAGLGKVQLRWMTAREYAALQGAPDHRFTSVSENQALFGFGDAVCVPVIEWIAHEYLLPLLNTTVGAAA